MVNISKPDKIRVVSDACARYKNTFLNENLQKGPDLLNNLAGILLRFRKVRYYVMADIEKMFHQDLVREQDREAQWFVWWIHKKKQFRDIRMNVHSFGKVDAPCCCL